jgi:hypothetical protein
VPSPPERGPSAAPPVVTTPSTPTAPLSAGQTPAFTGAPVGLEAIVGAALALLGSFLVWMARRLHRTTGDG